MKKTLVIILCYLGIASNLKADGEIGKFYKLKVDHPMQEVNASGVPGSFIVKTVPGGSKFTIVNKTASGDWVVNFWTWGSEGDLNTVRTTRTAVATANAVTFTIAAPVTPTTNIDKIVTYNFYYNGTAWEQRYFLISSGDLTLFSDEVLSIISPVGGAATLPFKYRERNGEFTKDLSISGLGGIKVKGGRWARNVYFNSMIGIGLATVTLDKNNTKGNLTDASDYSAISICMGEVFEWKKLQIGIFVGIDKVKKSDENDWVNQGKPWLGFGIGFAIFTETEPATEGKNK